MGSLYVLNLSFVCFFLTVVVSPSNGISDGIPQKNVTTVQATLGEDVYLQCSSPYTTSIYFWQKGDRSVLDDQAYTQNRLYVLKSQGMLILNTEAGDSGLFICTAFDTNLVVLKYRLEVVNQTEEDSGNSGDASQCGYSRQRSRIVGGREVNYPGAYPWMALLWHKGLGRPFCAGSLLSGRFVVTAAHCFSHSGFDPNDVEVRLGEHSITSTENYQVTMDIAEIISHPHFDQSTFDSDILLLRLQQPVVYSDHILPICLPSKLRGERLLQPGIQGYVTGWGVTQEGASDYSDVLRQARVSIIDHQQCGTQHTHVITNNMICAIGGSRRTEVRGPCNGDGGVPFIVKEDGRSYLVGISSWGIGCSDINFPGVYTRVGRFRHWILENINSDLQTCQGDLNQVQSEKQSLEDQVGNLQDQLEICQNGGIGEATSTVEMAEDPGTD